MELVLMAAFRNLVSNSPNRQKVASIARGRSKRDFCDDPQSVCFGIYPFDRASHRAGNIAVDRRRLFGGPLP